MKRASSPDRLSGRGVWAGLWAVFLTTAVHAGPALDFELPDVEGRRFHRLATAPPTTTVINFWDTECPPCIKELPVLDTAASHHADVQFIGVAVSSRSAVRAFLAEQPVRYLQLIATTEPRALLRRFGNAAGALPYTVVLSPDRRLCERLTGEVSTRWLEQVLAKCR